MKPSLRRLLTFGLWSAVFITLKQLIFGLPAYWNSDEYAQTGTATLVWPGGAAAATVQAITFPVAYSTAPAAVICNGTVSGHWIFATAITATGFNLNGAAAANVGGSNEAVSYAAIGTIGG